MSGQAQLKAVPRAAAVETLREAAIFTVHLRELGEEATGHDSFFVEGLHIEDAAGMARAVAAYLSRPENGDGIPWTVARVEYAGIFAGSLPS